MRRTIEGWLADAREVLSIGIEEDIEEIAEQALIAIQRIIEAHHRVGSSSSPYCSVCQDLWPCDTVRRIAKALEVRT